MSSKFSVRSIALALGLACAALGGAMQSADAGPVTTDVWYEFGFGNAPGPLLTGVGTVLATAPPDGNPIVQVDDPPWTITLTGPAILRVQDLFLSVDQFEIFDNAASLGVTSAPVPGSDCGSSITCAVNDPDFSRGEFLLGAGNHSLTGTHLLGIGGAAVFQIIEVAQVPEPASLGLLGAALAGFGLFRRRRQRA